MIKEISVYRPSSSYLWISDAAVLSCMDWCSWGQSVLVCKQSVVASRWIDQVALHAAFSSTANDD